MDFTEDLTLELPEVDWQSLEGFKENTTEINKGLVIEVAAIHEGLTRNFNHYGLDALEQSLDTWVTPYARPLILHHDIRSEPIGRVMGSRMDSEEDGNSFVRLQAAVLDPAGIEKVRDGRYLTGSVGGRADKVTCSVCEADWSNFSMFGDRPCNHKRGELYKGKLAWLNMESISWAEYSFVNAPADGKSGIRPADGSSTGESSDAGWVRPVNLYSVDMHQEQIIQLAEADGHDILENMKRKDASSIYLGTKGAYLSAIASVSEESEENSMTSEDALEVEEDIFDIAEELSDDLAAISDNESEEEKDSEDETEEEQAEISDTENEEDNTDLNEEADRPEGQEKAKDKDIDPHDSEGAPKNRESDEEDEESTTEEEQEQTPEEIDETESDEVDDTDLGEMVIQALESRVEELEGEVSRLTEENAELTAKLDRAKNALKKSLAERVVDTKIALGYEASEDRIDLINEHMDRSAASLADSLRDLARMVPEAPDYTKVPKVEPESMVADPDEDHTSFETPSEETSNTTTPEDVLVDALMGRRQL